MSLPSAVEEAAARVKRIRLSLDGRSLSEDSASAEGSSGQGGPAGPAAGDAAAPSSPQSEDRAAGDGARGDSGGDSGGGNSGSDGACLPARRGASALAADAPAAPKNAGQDPGCALRRTKSLARLRAEDFAAQQTSADGAASAGCLAQDVMQFLRAQQLADLCTMLVSVRARRPSRRGGAVASPTVGSQALGLPTRFLGFRRTPAACFCARRACFCVRCRGALHSRGLGARAARSRLALRNRQRPHTLLLSLFRTPCRGSCGPSASSTPRCLPTSVTWLPLLSRRFKLTPKFLRAPPSTLS